MLVLLSEWLSQFEGFFSVFQYLTLRAILAVLSSLGLSMLLGPVVIRKLNALQIGQAVRDDGPESHLVKSGTPTMGGVLILFSIVLSTLLWADLSNRYIIAVIFVTVTLAMVGWVDDYRKVVAKNSKGLSAKWKYLWQSLIGATVGIALYATALTPQETTLYVPFFKNVAISLGALYIIITYFMVVGFSNAVNLTDGLDGLAILPTVLVGAALGLIAYLVGNVRFAEYLHLAYIAGTGELVVYCAALVGAGLGFLWFNTYPAQVFMGDVGSLALGGALGIMAVMIRHEIVFIFMAGIFVLETVSVILQVASFKLTGRRIFRMAPIHHHFELKGWPEPRVIVRFWIITVILVLIGLATLKLR